MSESPDRHQRVRALFEHVREQPADAQAAALAAACAGDSALHQDVARLLAADARAKSFLEHGAVGAFPDTSTLIGTRVGLYEIRAAIGTGGMGQVYRAHDTKLHRDVALKILPEVFAADPDRLARFQREAQVLASLNHPHIAAIYGVEEVDASQRSGQAGVRALVLELVEGPTLGDRIAEGPIPLDETLRIARQIVDALDAAHVQGIVHRDLKPANVKLRPDGTVKVLDFGLAKALDPGAAGTDTSRSPTITSPALTRMGMILGTAAYMSPEQAKGRPADKRSDIWSFGCVVFEMLTGHLVFGGEGVSETTAFILTREPEWQLLPAETPASMRRLLRRCLEKDRARRLADIADARLELDEPVVETPSAADASVLPSPRRPTLTRWLPWSIAAASLALALWFAGAAFRDRSVVDRHVYRSSILVPGRLGGPGAGAGTPGTIGAVGAPVALSPDGRRLAFIATDTTGRSQLWTRTLDAPEAQPLADTADARSPFWSPDGQWLAFVQNGKLKKVFASGGRAITLCESARLGGSWSRDDILLFTQSTGSLAQVRATGGIPSPVTTIPANTEEMHVFPNFLPDGRHFVYAATAALSQGGQPYIGSLDATSRTPLPVGGAMVQYAHGFLWFLRGSTLMAQPFEATRRRLTGDAVPIAEQVRTAPFLQPGFFSVSASGVLVYQVDASPGVGLVWYDREGRPVGTLGTPADYADLQLSPDGRRALVSVGDAGTGNRDLWIFDVARGLRTRFTFEDLRPRRGAIWSSDGGRIAWSAERKGHRVVVQKASSGAGGEAVLLEDAFEKEVISWSPDGQFILYQTRSGPPRPFVLPLGGGNRNPFPLAQARAFAPQFSPDGRWVVYQSGESGRSEVYVAPFPGSGGSVQISTAGGFNARWRADGKEIFYLDGPNNLLMSAAVTLGRDRIDVGDVKPLFKLVAIGPRMMYDVSPDGQRILAVTQKAETVSGPLTLVINWPAILTQ